MKAASYGRVLLGASAVLFGVIGLIWHDADTWQNLPVLRLPLGAIVPDVLAIAQIVGGAAVLLPRSARFASIVLGAVYALFCLACVPGIVARPTVYVEYGGFFEWFSLVCGAIAVAVCAATESNPKRSASLARTARLGLGLCAISFALAQAIYFRLTASLVPVWIPPNQAFWTILTTIAFALAAAAALTGRYARLALRLMTLMIACFGVLVWVPLVAAHPQAHGNWSEFALNFLIAGAAWAVADGAVTLDSSVRFMQDKA